MSSLYHSTAKCTQGELRRFSGPRTSPLKCVMGYVSGWWPLHVIHSLFSYVQLSIFAAISWMKGNKNALNKHPRGTYCTPNGFNFSLWTLYQVIFVHVSHISCYSPLYSAQYQHFAESSKWMKLNKRLLKESLGWHEQKTKRLRNESQRKITLHYFTLHYIT